MKKYIEIYKKSEGTLGHKVHRKPTHTDVYLHATSHNHMPQLRATMKNLLSKITTISKLRLLLPEAGQFGLL